MEVIAYLILEYLTWNTSPNVRLLSTVQIVPLTIIPEFKFVTVDTPKIDSFWKSKSVVELKITF